MNECQEQPAEDEGYRVGNPQAFRQHRDDRGGDEQPNQKFYAGGWRHFKNAPISGCATWKGQSYPSGFPIIVEFTTVTAATDSDDCIGAANGPEHSRAFEPGGDEGFATRLDHSGTHEQSLLTELRVTHASGVALEIVGLGLDFLCQFLSFCGQGAQAIHQ